MSVRVSLELPRGPVGVLIGSSVVDTFFFFLYLTVFGGHFSTNW